jgi:hypothetical protein
MLFGDKHEVAWMQRQEKVMGISVMMSMQDALCKSIFSNTESSILPLIEAMLVQSSFYE